MHHRVGQLPPRSTHEQPQGETVVGGGSPAPGGEGQVDRDLLAVLGPPSSWGPRRDKDVEVWGCVDI